MAGAMWGAGCIMVVWVDVGMGAQGPHGEAAFAVLLPAKSGYFRQLRCGDGASGRLLGTIEPFFIYLCTLWGVVAHDRCFSLCTCVWPDCHWR